MDEKKDKNWFTRLDYSGIFFFELASKARSSELVYCVFYMDKPLLLWAGRPSVSMNGLTMSLQCLVESIASLLTHRRLLSSHRSRDTRPAFNYELSSLESWKKGVVKWKKKGIPYWIVPSQSNTKTSNEPLYVVGSRDYILILLFALVPALISQSCKARQASERTPRRATLWSNKETDQHP
jgi:hypothetical protein